MDTSDQPIRVNVEANPGVTNSNGLITYDKSVEQETEFVSFSDITQLNDTEIELAANSQETIELAIKTPETSFPGEILGGLYFELEQEAEASNQGVSISNKFAYVIGVVITDATQQTPVAAQVSLESVENVVFNYRQIRQSSTHFSQRFSRREQDFCEGKAGGFSWENDDAFLDCPK